ncbi:hypothetical protein BJ944DRAFT_272040 [Cunninghamella echinulata]|nr:hypothetical protein BJ944DRAFT_272040 [Cunninghamella echinulata]
MQICQQYYFNHPIQLHPKAKKSLPSYILKDMFLSNTNVKISRTGPTILEKISDTYLKQLCHDLETYADHAGRNEITSDDLELLMLRQRLITDNKSLEALAHENLPRELWDEICVSALADNYLYPT